MSQCRGMAVALCVFFFSFVVQTNIHVVVVVFGRCYRDVHTHTHPARSVINVSERFICWVTGLWSPLIYLFVVFFLFVFPMHGDAWMVIGCCDNQIGFVHIHSILNRLKLKRTHRFDDVVGERILVTRTVHTHAKLINRSLWFTLKQRVAFS